MRGLKSARFPPALPERFAVPENKVSESSAVRAEKRTTARSRLERKDTVCDTFASRVLLRGATCAESLFHLHADGIQGCLTEDVDGASLKWQLEKP